MAVCLIFVFLALVQFAYVNVLSRVEKRRKTSNIGKIALGVMAKKAAEENEQKKQTANGTDVEAGTSEGGAKSKVGTWQLISLFRSHIEAVSYP